MKTIVSAFQKAWRFAEDTLLDYGATGLAVKHLREEGYEEAMVVVGDNGTIVLTYTTPLGEEIPASEYQRLINERRHAIHQQVALGIACRRI